MQENENIELDGIAIRRTVDGRVVENTQPVEETAPERKSRRNPEKPKKSGSDRYIWGIYLTLLVISVIELFSASSTEVSGTNVYSPLIRHGIFLVIGLGIVLLFERIHFVHYRRWAVIFAVASLILLLFSSFMGVSINGAQRALRVAGFTIQPAEMVKLSVILLLASILSRNQKPGGVTTRGVITCAIAVLIFGGSLWKNGLTNMILLMGVSISMLLIGGIEWRKFWMVIGVYCCAGALLFAVKYITPSHSEFDEIDSTEVVSSGRADTHKGRIGRWLKGTSPEDPMDDLNRQVIFSNFAQANGGVMGQGPGNSRESARLPLAFSDYIFSIIVEDTGLVGGCALLVLYLLLVARAGRIAYKCSRAFPAFLILGCAVLIVMQALVHMAIVTGLFPVSGQPLPFISKGGTSVLVMSAAIGMMLSVSRYAVTNGNKKDIKAELRQLPEDMQAANYSAQHL